MSLISARLDPLRTPCSSQENTLIDDNGDLLLCDFGLACVLDTRNSATQGNGTVLYCSPDVLLSGRKSLAGDIWSWGCLVMEVRNRRSNRVPF